MPRGKRTERTDVMENKENVMDTLVNGQQGSEQESDMVYGMITPDNIMGDPIPRSRLAEQVTKKTGQKEYAPSDAIPCRSITAGYVNFSGRKTGNVYSWMNANDISDVEYQDLRAAMLSESPYIYDPIFIIEDEELLALPEWRKVVKVYESMYSPKDIAEILDLPDGQMRQVVSKLPKGAQKSLATIAKTRMDNGQLDSIRKVKLLDELLGTDLSLFLGVNE